MNLEVFSRITIMMFVKHGVYWVTAEAVRFVMNLRQSKKVAQAKIKESQKIFRNLIISVHYFLISYSWFIGKVFYVVGDNFPYNMIHLVQLIILRVVYVFFHYCLFDFVSIILRIGFLCVGKIFVCNRFNEVCSPLSRRIT